MVQINPNGSVSESDTLNARALLPVEFSIHQPMISGVGDLEGRKYHLFIGKNGRRWVVADQEAAAENIYADGGPGSRGMAGRTVAFDLVDGRTVEFTGPWKAGAEGLFKETGHDVRDRYFTQGVVAYGRVNGKWPGPDTYTEVLHYDQQAVLGTYDRVRDIAKLAANESGRPVFYAMISKGGGGAAREMPNAPTPDVRSEATITDGSPTSGTTPNPSNHLLGD